ncbi:MAG TPA: nucleotide exchange factor GrpE [Sedimenticola sp.]|nr:nucleotide exchange factor GrpE [Sedimenticola sp.]
MDPDAREQLVARFRDYLETAAETGPEEEGREVDLSTLFTELAALKNEVRLESRQVKQALDHSRELLDGLQESNQRASEELTRQRREKKVLQARAERPLLLEILALRDRLEAAHQSLEGYRPGLLQRMCAGPGRLISGLGEGLEITLRRLDDLLARYRVTPVETDGKRFDPHTMRVCDTEQRDELEPGVVLAGVRRGYLRDGQVLRLAEVIVNKKEAT